MWWTVSIFGWVVCGILSYLVIRKDHRVSYSHMRTIPAWSVADRRTYFVSSLFGPFALFASIMVYVSRSTGEDNPGHKPAKW